MTMLDDMSAAIRILSRGDNYDDAQTESVKRILQGIGELLGELALSEKNLTAANRRCGEVLGDVTDLRYKLDSANDEIKRLRSVLIQLDPTECNYQKIQEIFESSNTYYDERVQKCIELCPNELVLMSVQQHHGDGRILAIKRLRERTNMDLRFASGVIQGARDLYLKKQAETENSTAQGTPSRVEA